jgi:hypothetical protein
MYGPHNLRCASFTFWYVMTWCLRVKNIIIVFNYSLSVVKTMHQFANRVNYSANFRTSSIFSVHLLIRCHYFNIKNIFKASFHTWRLLSDCRTVDVACRHLWKLRLHLIFYYFMRHESYGRRTTDVAVCDIGLRPRSPCDRHWAQ